MECCNARMFFAPDNMVAELEEVTASKNIVRISYSVLAENKEYHHSSPFYCRGCQSALCFYSEILSRDDYYKKMTEEDANEKLNDEKQAEQNKKDQETSFLRGKYIKDLSENEVGWICEFCGVHNKLPKDTLKPQEEDELYLLKKTEKKVEEEKTTDGETTHPEVDTSDNTSLIFCIDVSGSMGESHQVEKDGKSAYLTRIKLVSEAVLKQVEQMKISHPNRKIGIVTFEDYVRLYGDRTNPIMANVDINNYDKLLEFSSSLSSDILTKPLKDTFQSVTNTIKSLQPMSCTALGPGLLCSLGMVQGRPGSRIILCTDGLANRGLGTLGGSGQVSGPSRAFYEKLGDLAVDNGVSISIITIEGNACRVDALGPLTDRTAGTILRVNPANMDLSEMASNSLVATNVKLRTIMHEGLAFEHEDSSHLHNNGSILMKQVGSVSANNEAYFEYRVKKLTDLQEAGINLEETKSIPMQCQITYTDLKGNEFVRVICKQQNLTKDVKEAKKEVKASILTGYVQKEGANLVLKGRASDAKKKNAMWSNYMQEVADECELDEDNMQAWNEFQVENQELNDLITQTESKSMNVAQQDDVNTKLYKIKQTKKKK